MKNKLKTVFQKSVDILEKNSHVLAAYHTGSVGTEREDEFSDVDPVFLLDPEYVDTFEKELPELFEKTASKPVLLWPERWIWKVEAKTNYNITRNYAVFFEINGELLQYDINYKAAPNERRIKIHQRQFIFDKTGILEIVTKDDSSIASENDKILWNIEMYWIYVYIHAKYIKRCDLFRLLYAQQELFQEHLELLRIHYNHPPNNWWPLTINKLDESIKKNMLIYFGKKSIEEISKALPAQIHQFTQDARDTCAKFKVNYPLEFEKSVLKYLKKTKII